VALYTFAALVVVVSVYPFVYAFATSLKTGNAIFDTSLWPREPTLRNYVQLFAPGGQPFGSHLLNSILVATLTVAVSMFPQVAVLSGLFELMQALGLYDRAVGLVLPYLIFTLPFTVWILTTFMRGLPIELEEAAIMDGCGPLRIVFQVFLPLLVPALVSTGLLAFIGAWNEFLFALTFTSSNTTRTVPVAIALLSGATQYETPWGIIMAASVIVTVPLIVLVLIFQRKIVAGLTAGGVKG
jgi:trehalose/maltose transport system permease protein